MEKPFKPFRWNVTRRNELGSLISGSDEEFHTFIADELRSLGIMSLALKSASAPFDWLVDELAHAAAKSLAFSQNGDLVFVGRSPESLFDFLSGILMETSWASRIALLPFSMRSPVLGEEVRKSPRERQVLEQHLESLLLMPGQILKREHPVVFVDIVESGDTLGNLVQFIKAFADQGGFVWEQVRNKIRIVGLTIRTKTSPNTWRWQQHASWVKLLPAKAVKNVSIPELLFHYLGGKQAKLTPSYHHGRWLDPEVMQPKHDAATQRALKLAFTLFNCGCKPGVRLEFAQRMSKLSAVDQSWFRSLIGELRASS